MASNLPFNNWHHITAHVYGSWLRGDPRGWRARHHRENVDGDYNNPPPKGEYDPLLRRSQTLMLRDPVKIEASLRDIVIAAIAEKLTQDSIEILVASVDAKHLHILARFPDRNPRHWIGRAKKNASHALRQKGLREEAGGLWAKRCLAEPIRDRRHQPNVFRYILKHGKEGAAIWRFDRAPGRAPSSPHGN